MDMRDAHVGIQVDNLTDACALLERLLGLTFAEPLSWPIRVRVGDEIEKSVGRFTVSRQGPPYLEVTENVEGSKVWHSDGQALAFHHIGFWVEDVEAASQALTEAGFPVEAGGLNDSDHYRYTYHNVGGLRVEVCDAGARAAFERWATTGRAEGAADEFSRSGAGS